MSGVMSVLIGGLLSANSALDSLPLANSKTKTGAMLDALANGPMNSKELAAVAGVSSSLVLPLLKYHVASGRVLSVMGRSGRQVYSLNARFDADLHREIAEAIRFIERHGYEVVRRER